MDIIQTISTVFDLKEISDAQINATTYIASNLPDKVGMQITVVNGATVVFNYVVPGDHDFSQHVWHPTDDEGESLCDLEGVCAHILEEIQHEISGPWNPLDPTQPH
jgi:hypothetical protein